MGREALRVAQGLEFSVRARRIPVKVSIRGVLLQRVSRSYLTRAKREAKTHTSLEG